jgi:hypothetical protein
VDPIIEQEIVRIKNEEVAKNLEEEKNNLMQKSAANFITLLKNEANKKLDELKIAEKKLKDECAKTELRQSTLIDKLKKEILELKKQKNETRKAGKTTTLTRDDIKIEGDVLI